ncbi:MAG TPA: RagB/SusD family nutrient uptake outer membrane protein [Porphyromonadaceae bacterium]|nr:RagB/SusD family nutrient uptake outer membrane protein [Porphyromonadaceae bacterium]HBX21808.1 RagB/SusD family nutrient uptake outer membrane protein [Porphyromonadaceae bacterium]
MKNNIIKSLIICAIGLLSLTQIGCSDLLDQEPQGKWARGDNPGGSFQTDVFSLYAQVKGWGVTGGIPAFAVHSIRSEDVEKGSTLSDGSDVLSMYDNFNYNTSDGNLASYYTSNYELIHTANTVLADIQEAKDNGDVLARIDSLCEGEAHFFRAFLYFNLVRAFGEVPLIDFKISDAAETNIPKSTAEKIYELIDADLTQAEKLLPRQWESNYLGRVTWGTARALHAKTYMQRNDWTNMLTAATEVINSGIYNLNTPFNQIFRESGENSSESIFELQCTATAALPASTSIGSQYAEVQGVRGSGDWDLGWGWNCPTPLLAAAFEEGDPRKDETLLYFLKPGENPESIPENTPYGEKPIAQDVLNRYYNKKVYTDPAKRRQFSKHGHWMNIRIIRLAEMYLIAAEAANELGNTAEAQNYLEAVRNRARGSNASVLPKVTTTDQTKLRDAIRHERRVELAVEWDRFYDLVRWGVAKDVLHAAGKTGYQDRHALLPLPQAEVDKSNGVLIQNPNY